MSQTAWIRFCLSEVTQLKLTYLKSSRHLAASLSLLQNTGKVPCQACSVYSKQNSMTGTLLYFPRIAPKTCLRLSNTAAPMHTKSWWWWLGTRRNTVATVSFSTFNFMPQQNAEPSLLTPLAPQIFLIKVWTQAAVPAVTKTNFPFFCTKLLH